jgi:hypothetical protein
VGTEEVSTPLCFLKKGNGRMLLVFETSRFQKVKKNLLVSTVVSGYDFQGKNKAIAVG